MARYNCNSCQAVFNVNNCKIEAYKLDHYFSAGAVRLVNGQLSCELAAEQFANQMDVDTGLPWTVTDAVYCEVDEDAPPAPLQCP